MEKFQQLTAIIFSFSQTLTGQPGYHPALIVKRQAADSFVSEEAYISFGGCGASNKSLIDELPFMINKLSVLAEGLANLQIENSLLKKVIIHGKQDT